MGKPDLPRLREALEGITASLNALREGVELHSQHGPVRKDGRLSDVSETGVTIGSSLAPDWLPIRSLRDIPVLPPPGADFGEVLGPVFENLGQSARVDRVALFLREREEDRVVARAGRGFRPNDLDEFSIEVGAGLVGRAVAEGQPIHISSPGPENGDPFLTRFPVREAIAFPVRSGAQVVGALYVGRTAPIPFEQRDFTLLAFLAERVGTWIHAVPLFGQMQDQVDRLKELVCLSLEITSSRDLSGIIRATAEVGARLVRAQTAAVILADSSGRLTIQGGLGLPPGFDGWQGQIGEGLIGEVVREGRLFVSTDLVANGLPSLLFAEASPGCALLLLPLRGREETFGCLALADAAPRIFSPEEVEALTLLSSQAALAIENARLYAQARDAYEDLKSAQEDVVGAEKARALVEIAGGIAHDFNNILAIILGTTELMLERVENPATRKGLETIEEAAWRAAETVRRLQSFAARGGEEDFVSVSLNAIVVDAVGATRPRWKGDAEARGVRVDVVTEVTDIPHVLGNPVELREMVVNLIFNALDAMPGGGRIVIGTRVKEGAVELTVCDTGVGIPEEASHRIFDPFFTTKGPRHSGLGLSLVHGVVGRHRAQIDVSSREGKGATFLIRFPVSSEAARFRAPAPAPPVSDRPAAAVPPARLLVVEDEATIRSLLVQIFTTAGHTVRCAADGQEGLTFLEREAFDVVFTDLSMPEVSGWEIIHAVKKRDAGIPVVLVTGWGDQLDPQRLQESSVDLVLAKPFRIEQALSTLAEALARRRPSPW